MRERIKKIFENADADVIVIMNGSSNIDMTFFKILLQCCIQMGIWM